MKIRILITLLLVAKICEANMSSPISEGTAAGTAFTSKDIDILSEIIQIKIDKDYKTAKFVVEYTIQSDVAGRQIPLLFCAQDYKDSFFIWIDNQRVDLQNIPEKYTRVESSPLSMFSNSFKKENQTDESDEVSIYWYENSGYVYKINDLKYFETDIVKGIHKVRVEYTARVWTDNSGWIKEYSFRYSLTPAKFWRSFGTLNISVEQEGAVRQLSTNIGQPVEKAIQKRNNWTFTKLPDEYLEFSYSPKTNRLARTLIFIEPLGLSILASIIMFALHLFLVLRYRRRFVNKKYSPIVIFGSLVIPFLILLSYMFSYGLIDTLIGDDAGGNHGYVFLWILFYPILLTVYWRILWLFDRQKKGNSDAIEIS